MDNNRRTLNGHALSSIVLFLIILGLTVSFANAVDSTVRIGVLAKRGPAHCLEKWSPTAEYLTRAIPGSTHVIIPVEFDDIYTTVENGDVDFILANSSFYVELESWYGVNRIATLKNKVSSGTVTTFGGVIFTRRDRADIRKFSDLKGKRFMAVKQTSFGGWRMAWLELEHAGIDPHEDFASLQFGGTHDAVVYAVRDGRADAGTVRTDTFERMAMEGKIDIHDFRVFHVHGGWNNPLPFMHSTRAYPEWPMAKLKHTSNALAEKVAVALIAMPAECAAATAAQCAGWTIPLNYQSVHECLKELRLGPYEHYGEITLSAVFNKYWKMILPLIVLFLGVCGLAIYTQRLNQNLKKTHEELHTEVEERRQTQAALKKSEVRFRELMELLPQTIFEMDLDTKISFINQFGMDTFQFTPGDLEKGITAIDFISPNQRPMARKNLERLFKGEEPRLNEYAVVKKDGTSFPAMVRTMVRFRDGNPDGFIAFCIDITDQKELETQFRQAQKMEAIGTLVGGIAHDFNNILFPMLGFAEMLKEDIPDDSSLQGSVDEILYAALRAKELIKQLLAYSRQTDQEKKPIKLQSIVTEGLKLLRSSIPTTIKIEECIDPGCGMIEADPVQMHQVIMNLATNAFHAMEENGGTLRVALEPVQATADQPLTPVLANGSYACLTVADSGTGIEKDIMDKLFDPYFTTKEQGKGTGLGLSVVQGIVRKTGGDIRITSDPEQGTAVNVFLPIVENAVDEQATRFAAIVPGNRERVLLVDDEQAIIRMEQSILERLGYQVTARTGSMDALDTFTADSTSFDLVITDMTMPEMTGVQLAGKMKHIRPDIPIIICTGYSNAIDEEKCKKLGIDGFVMKPIVKRELAEAIRNVFDTSGRW